MTHTPDANGWRAKLSQRQRTVLGRMDNEWRPASHAISLHVQSPGIVCSALADKGYLERRSDPDVWGRSQYRRSRVAPGSEGEG
jgi:hypothetical protein